MKNLIAVLLVILLATILVSGKSLEDAKMEMRKGEVVSYFIDTVTAKAKTLPEYDRLWLGGGVDGFSLMKVYKGLVPSDFNNVIAYQGEYHETDGKLYFTGHAASNSAVIYRGGMEVLLQNLSKRLGIEPSSKEKVDEMLEKLK